jgi:hypothetical protein
MARLRSLTCALALGLATLAASSVARADDPKGGSDTEGIGTASDPNVDESGDTSVNDDPNAADAETTKEENPTAAVARKGRITKSTYPVAVIHRPMTLPANTAEIAIDAPVYFGGPVDNDETGAIDIGARATQVLHAAYGVTQDIQVGVSYGFGSERLSPPEGAKGFEAGKAFSVDGGYTVLPEHLAVTVSLPFYADPFASSLVLGAPFRINMSDKLALVGGQDLLEVAFNKWPVRPGDPEFNLSQALRDVPGATPFSKGAVNLQFGAQVQVKPNVVISGWTRIHIEDFTNDDTPVSLYGGVMWSKWNLDLGARLGFYRLDEASSFGLGLSAAYRL